MRSGSVMTAISLMLLLTTFSLTATGVVSPPLPEETEFGDSPVNGSGLRAGGFYSFPDDPAAANFQYCVHRAIQKYHGLSFQRRVLNIDTSSCHVHYTVAI